MDENDQNMQRLSLADLHLALPKDVTPSLINSSPTLRPAPASAACERCGGAGYYKEAVPFWHPHFAKLFPCACTIAFWGKRAVARLGDELGSLADKTFANFDLDRDIPKDVAWKTRAVPIAAQRGALIKATELCQSYADAPRSWLYLYGTVGSGKSHLAAAIGNVRASRNEQVRYRSAPGLIDALKAGFENHTSDAILDDLLRCDLLIIDDLGAENSTPWTRERFFRLLNERQGKPTILTSNRDVDDLGLDEDVDAARIADRIAQQAARVLLPVYSYRRLDRGAP